MLKQTMVVAACLLIIGCSRIQTDDVIADYAVLRATWKVPAQQAGVYEQLRSDVAELDKAIMSGNAERIVKALRALEPTYRQVRASIETPTDEQIAFDARVQDLWDKISRDGAIDRAQLIDASILALRLLVTRL